MLLLLDIDGTLCDTYSIDEECYVESLRLCFGFADVITDWSSYPDVTDSGLLEYLFNRRLERSPSDSEAAQMADCFYDLLRAEFKRVPASCQAISGGTSFVNTLRRREIPFGIATGGWQKTAALKLELAGYEGLEPLISSANDSTKRVEICRLAAESAEQRFQCNFDSVVYIGDGQWDQKAALELGYRFVGRSETRSKFSDDVGFVISDFTDDKLIDRLLNLCS